MIISINGLVGESRVLTRNGYRRMSGISVGDYVLTSDAEWARVIGKHDVGYMPTLEMSFVGKEDIMRCAPTNRFLVLRYGESSPRAVEARDMEYGDRMLVPCACNNKGDVVQYNGVMLTKLPYMGKKAAAVEKVYSLEIENGNSFITNGCITMSHRR